MKEYRAYKLLDFELYINERKDIKYISNRCRLYKYYLGAYYI